MSGAQSFRDLEVYQLAYRLATTIFDASRRFPQTERLTLTDQVRRSSRSVAANIAEAYRVRQYTKLFSSKLSVADCEATETQVWLDFAHACGYLPTAEHAALIRDYASVGRMLGAILAHPEKFKPKGTS
jgi:four helix bundle protein